MKLTIREMSWYKRRLPTQDPKPISVQIPDIRLINNHRCDMIVEYDDGNTHTLSGRVNLNDVKNVWAIHGIDHQGHQCMVDIDETE